jgi:hypothetical protein
VALRFMKMRLLAPRETIHLEVLRPIPPSPPGNRYEASRENIKGVSKEGTIYPVSL